MKCAAVFALAFLCYALVISQTKSQTCQFNVGFYNLSSVVNCFQAITFNSTQYKNSTILQVNRLVNLYVFTKISIQSGSPYNITVDLTSQLNTINATSYTYDVAFHLAITSLFNKLGDGNTGYLPPTPYLQFTFVRPFIFDSVVVNGVQQIIAANETVIAGKTYSSITGVNANQYVGKTISTVNGLSAINWIQSIGNLAGGSRDAAARFNFALYYFATYFNLGIGQIPSSSDSYSFSGVNNGAAVSLPIVVYCTQSFSGINDFTSQIPFGTFKKSDKKQDIGKRANVILDSYGVACYVMASNSTVVVKIPSMAVTGDINYYNDVLNATYSCINVARQQNYQNLIIDVLGNVDGQNVNDVDFAYFLLQVFVPYWRGNTSYLAQPYDASITNYFNQLSTTYRNSFGLLLLNPSTLLPFSPLSSFYTNTNTYLRGGVSGTYTSKGLWNYDGTSFDPFPQSYTFKKILLLTDGTCGYACSQFATILRFYGVAGIVGTGGIYNQVMESSSYTGGLTLRWQDVVQSVADSTLADYLPTTATMQFSFFEMYAGNSTTPREFLRYNPDFRLNVWQINSNNLGSVYSSAAAFFNNAQYSNIVKPFGVKYNPPTVSTFTPSPTPSSASFLTFGSVLLFVFSFLLFF